MAKTHTGGEWFAVDQAGLRELIARKGYGFIVHELVQNAWDAPGCTDVRIIVMAAAANNRQVQLTVTDDADGGVKNLRDLYTLFAPSEKRDNPELRGRFNLGEKLAIACSYEADVFTEAGKVTFGANGKRTYSAHKRRLKGTAVTLLLPGSARRQLLDAAQELLPPEGITTTVTEYPNDPKLAPQERVLVTPRIQWRGLCTLPTEKLEHGVLAPTSRRTMVSLHARMGEEGRLHELGIPIMQIDLPWHVNVEQKVPLTLDRTAVTQAFLRKLYVQLLNAAYQELTTLEMATAPWVRIAGAHPDCSTAAVAHLATLRFGDKAVAYDPNDPEASKRAMAEGYTVVHGGSLSGGEWANVKAAGVLLPAGKITGTPTVLGGGAETPELQELGEGELREEEIPLATYIAFLTGQLVGGVRVRYYRDRSWEVIAACGPDRILVVNLGRLLWEQEHELHGVLLHELAHIESTDHLSDEYHRALSRLGARFGALAGKYPVAINPWTYPGQWKERIAAWRVPANGTWKIPGT